MRLNKEIRTEIVNKAYALSDIPQAKLNLTARSVALSEAVRLASLGEGVDDILKTAEKEIKIVLKKRGVPEYFHPGKIFDRNGYVSARFGGTYVNLNLNGCIQKNHSHLVSSDTASSGKKFTGECLDYESSHPFAVEYDAIVSDARALKDREKVLRATVQGTVDKFTTVEKLLEMWPESKALIPKHIEKANAPMPIAIAVADLNHLIGLPK